jgi:phosphoribosylglycinamide formyltransferase-1
MNKKARIAIFASGSGSNAATIMDHFKENDLGEVVLVVTNNTEAGVIVKAEQRAVPVSVLGSGSWRDTAALLQLLERYDVDFIVLAGWLKLIDADLVKAFPNRIVNIHPALLPKFGGKGMYGMNVHKAVVASGEKESGMTIHYVNEVYDSGAIIHQSKTSLKSSDSPEQVAKKVLKLEHEHYPKVIEA